MECQRWENGRSLKKLVPFPFYPPQIPHRLAWNQVKASTARG